MAYSSTIFWIEKFFVWSTNVLEFNKLVYFYFGAVVVVVFFFLLVSIILRCESRLFSFNSYIVKILSTLLAKAPHPTQVRSHSSPRGMDDNQMPVGCPRGCRSFDLVIICLIRTKTRFEDSPFNLSQCLGDSSDSFVTLIQSVHSITNPNSRISDMYF